MIPAPEFCSTHLGFCSCPEPVGPQLLAGLALPSLPVASGRAVLPEGMVLLRAQPALGSSGEPRSWTWDFTVLTSALAMSSPICR